MTSEILSVGAVAAALVSIIAFGAKVTKPYIDLSRRVDELERKQKASQKTVDANLERLEEQAEMNALLLRGVKTLMAHEVDGNHTDQLRLGVEEIDKMLYQKAGTLGG